MTSLKKASLMLAGLALAGAASVLAQPAPAAAPRAMRSTPSAGYPAPPMAPVTDAYHGVSVRDDYRALEQTDSPAMKAWIAAQNRLTRTALDAAPGRAAIKKELLAMMGDGRITRSGLVHAGGQLFAVKHQPPRNQAMLVTISATGEPQTERVIVDANRLDRSGKTAIDWYVPSLDGKQVAVSLSKNGSEDGSLHVYDVRTRRALPDVVPRVQYPTGGGSVAWSADGKGFYYTRYPQARERPAADLHFYQQVYFHTLGTPAARDTYVIGKEFPRIAEIVLSSTDDARYLLADVSNGDGGEHGLYLRGPDQAWTRIADYDEGFRIPRFGRDGRLYALGLKGSPRGRIVALRLGDHAGGLAQAETVVPESEAVVQGLMPTQSRLYVDYLVGGPTEFRMFDLAGKPLGSLGAEAVASVGFPVRLAGDAILFGSESYVKAFTWYAFDPAREGAKPVATRLEDAPAYTTQGELPGVEVVREFAVSRDGTRVPINIVRNKGATLDGSHPVLLSGYGGYGISISPYLSRSVAFWLRHGGVYAEVNLRGGGEFGEEWHLAGNLTRKQNVFDDFIASAQWLIANGYTTPQRLAIEGGSNGGLLMGAALVQRPDLFRAVVSHVGIYDMLRSETSPNGEFNVTEFGSVKDEAQFKALYAYSPQHHVQDGTAYPAVLLTTGQHDGRVDPWMSYKMAARLQAANPTGRPVLLRAAADTGHGIGSSLASVVELQTDVYSFLFMQLGMR